MAGRRARIVLVLLLVAVSSAYVDLRVRAHPQRAYAEYIPGVVHGTEEAPGRYRVLAPFVVDWTARTTGWSMETAWYITRLLWFVAAWLAFQAYLETWFSSGTALGGTALAAALLPMTYTNSWAHPDHIPELALFTLCCLALVRRRDGWFAVALALASLNRETAAFLVLFYALARPMTRRHLAITASMGALWAGIYAGLRVWRGLQHYDYFQLGRNLEFMRLLPPTYDPYYRAYGWFIVALLVPLLALAWPPIRAGSPPREMIAAVAVVPAVLLTGFVFSSVIETRIFTPVLPLMLPAVMFAAERPIRRSDREGESQ